VINSIPFTVIFDISTVLILTSINHSACKKKLTKVSLSVVNINGKGSLTIFVESTIRLTNQPTSSGQYVQFMCLLSVVYSVLSLHQLDCLLSVHASLHYSFQLHARVCVTVAGALLQPVNTGSLALIRYMD